MACSGFVASFPRHLLWQIQPPLQLKQSLPAKARILLPAVVVVEWKTTVEAHPIARGAIPGKIRPGAAGTQQQGRASRLREKGPCPDSGAGRIRKEKGSRCAGHSAHARSRGLMRRENKKTASGLTWLFRKHTSPPRRVSMPRSHESCEPVIR